MKLRKWGTVPVALGLIAALTMISPALGGPSLQSLVKKEVTKQLNAAQTAKKKKAKRGPPGPAGPAGANGAAGSALGFATVNFVANVAHVDTSTSSPGITDANVSLRAQHGALLQRAAVHSEDVGGQRRLQLRGRLVGPDDPGRGRRRLCRQRAGQRDRGRPERFAPLAGPDSHRVLLGVELSAGRRDPPACAGALGPSSPRRSGGRRRPRCPPRPPRPRAAAPVPMQGARRPASRPRRRSRGRAAPGGSGVS